MLTEPFVAISVGDFAQVFRGRLSGEKVAVKIVKDPGNALSEGNVPLEALLLEGLSHPCVVGYRTWKMASTTAGQQRLWIVMDFCNRGTLAVRLLPNNSGRILAPSVLRRIFEDNDIDLRLQNILQQGCGTCAFRHL